MWLVEILDPGNGLVKLSSVGSENMACNGRVFS